MTIGTPEFFPNGGPIVIRDATFNRVAAATGFANVFKQRAVPSKAEDLPMATVWHGGDRTTPWGDPDVGAPSFEHTLTMVVDIMVKAASSDALDPPITGLVEGIRATLLTDASWVNLVESIERCDVTYSYPSEGSFFYARGVVEFELKFRSEWAPVVENDLLEILTTYPPATPGAIQSITFASTP